MSQLLMPKATAVWLIDNTALTFEQIAEFCGLHMLEVQGIADGDVAVGMQGLDPILNGQLTQQELDRCQADPSARMKLAKHDIPEPLARAKGPRYTPISKRQDKPDAIAYVLKTYPQLTDANICKLIGTTKPTISAIRDRSHWNMANIKAQNPVILGLCSQRELESMLAKASKNGLVQPVVDEPDAPEVEEEPDPRDGGPLDPAKVFKTQPVNEPSTS